MSFAAPVARTAASPAPTVAPRAAPAQAQRRPPASPAPGLSFAQLPITRPVVQRDGDDDFPRRRIPSLLDGTGLRGPLFVPGTGVSLGVGPLAPTHLLGSTFPLPTYLHLNSIADLRLPPVAARLSPQQLVVGLLSSIDLSATPRPGTPPDRLTDPLAQKRVSVVDPILSVDPRTGAFTGTATLRVDSDYPSHLVGPTDVAVSIYGTELSAFSGTASVGPLVANFKVQLKYDTAALERALSPVAQPAGGLAGAAARLRALLVQHVPGIRLDSVPAAVQSLFAAVSSGRIDGAAFAGGVISEITAAIPPGADLSSLRAALTNLAGELRRPGYAVTGTASLFGLPVTSFRASSTGTTSPTTSSTAYGIIIVPPGALASVPAPALGVTTSRTTPQSSFSLTAAALPSISTEAISQGKPVLEQFPIYSYAELTYTRKVSKDLELGLRLNVNLATPDIPRIGRVFSGGGPTPPAFQPGGSSAPAPPPNVGLSVVGTF